jgi:hypothetical protein
MTSRQYLNFEEIYVGQLLKLGSASLVSFTIVTNNSLTESTPIGVPRSRSKSQSPPDHLVVGEP